jgi:hypothetical protein
MQQAKNPEHNMNAFKMSWQSNQQKSNNNQTYSTGLKNIPADSMKQTQKRNDE